MSVERTGKGPAGGTPQEEDRMEVEAGEPLAGVNDPGGAHIKGYSADPRPEPPVPAEGPIPLASASDEAPAVREQELQRENGIRATGRDDSDFEKSDERVIGADR